MEVVEQKKDGHHQLMFESVLELVSLFWGGGSCCGSVGRAIASDNRDLRFESSQKEFVITANSIEKSKVKKKEARNAPYKKSFVRVPMTESTVWVNGRLNPIKA